jgi:BirA family transcriptional regulator, biotin operon repressor / biotin---[acetyl-CoA-carboxylase] ligase
VATGKNTPRVLHFATLDSTNEEALRQLTQGAETPLWIVADEQSQGRGRNGRVWQSPKGNLYASLLLRLNVNASAATGLSFLAALAAYDAIASKLQPQEAAGLRLKWPNDVMLAGAKVAGILIESLADPGLKGLAAIVGIGINVSFAPSGLERAAGSLGLDPAACAAIFSALASFFDIWLARWAEGRGFAGIREAWLSRAHEPGDSISVNLNNSAIRGIFRGLDDRGALKLETSAGVVITVTAGDIHPGAQG